MSSLISTVRFSPYRWRCANEPLLIIRSHSTEFLDAIRSVNPPGRWKILVVDEYSQKLLGSVLKQFDILEENVTRMFVMLLHILQYSHVTEKWSNPSQLTVIHKPNLKQYICSCLQVTMWIVSSRIFQMLGSNMPLHTYSLSKVCGECTPKFNNVLICGQKACLSNFSNDWPLQQQSHISKAWRNFISIFGVCSINAGSWFQDNHFPLTATESQAFSLHTPSLFFSMYSPPRSDSSFKAARQQLEEELRFTSKCVRGPKKSQSSSRCLMVPFSQTDFQCLHITRRIPLYSVLLTFSPPPTWPA